MVLRVLLFMFLFLSGLKVANMLSITWFEILLPSIITLVMICFMFLALFIKESSNKRRRNP